MSDRKVLITGAFGALGRVVAKAARARGWRIAALDYAPEPPAELTEALCPRCAILGGVDLVDAAAATAAVDKAVKALGGLHALVNLAGGFVWQTTADGDPEAWDRMHALNLKTTLNASRAALPALSVSGSGRIVNVGANAALKADAGMGAYAASKAAVHRLTESLARETLGAVSVNAVLPSILDTPANRAAMPDADPSPWVDPADLASVILFLASEEARAVTGALLPVTGKV